MSKAAKTRTMILTKSFELIYKQGYQATSIDNILATTKVTKGAFFYHFKNKDQMGLAMINDIICPGMHTSLVKPLLDTNDPVVDIYEMMRIVLLKVPFLRAKYGCPVVNLIEEMSAINDDFKSALLRFIKEWQEAVKGSIEQGKALNKINKEVNAGHVACFVVAGYSGVRNMGKAMGSSCYTVFLQEFKNYLKQLA
ncbi:TetR/AcrR family transcriptional regulator [Mucilaginibacter phyllosphaerae]|uniref:AcrR family transcriptional regulator n=1 Tax=Mucilaginibacter phyllosphaerae TaxID=1812349 RepID=A0A4Y8AAD7_9SPHI|nr:TetR/AcrR family transcriptional regulator [Mucilaginibacter phyllosphaerae]MBB3969549.1 AcrR family transcriptional regulator [Mucilaginibacter phyllosphaerae]TEW64942.1 TetR/AcrR family transcriptional regulator [Mucilaginibacter phyllosphaerae]